jgi:hypothetical protein
MVDTQQDYAKFEELSEYIVRHIFKDTGALIRRTPATKDGGYDIVVEYSDGKEDQKVYFECKLRKGNLNLRDIAANVIIAFNEGAVTMVAITNHDYTIQTEENLRQFSKKTILNIKVIIGNDINLLVRKYNISLSDTLSNLISPKRTNRKSKDSLFQIDFSKEKLYEQVLYKKLPDTTPNITFIPEQQKTKVKAGRTILQQGGLLAVSGFIGIGKHAFVETIISGFDSVTIMIDASLHQTQERILLDILFNIWGISVVNVIEDFTDTHIDMIIERLSGYIENKKTLDILQRIFGDKRIKGINDEKYNLLICDYILDISQLHRDKFKYLFIFENLSYANNENSILLTYLIKCLSREKIPCVIIQDSEEYTVQRSFDLQFSFRQLSNFLTIELNAYTIDEAVQYIRIQCPEMSAFVAEGIIKQVGTRKTNISMFLNYIKKIDISMMDNKRIAYELQTIQSNALPTIANKILNYHRQQDTSMLFNILFLFHGKITDQLCDKLSVDLCFLERLIKENILIYRQGYYICANRIVYTIIIDEWGVDDSPKLRQLALKILQTLENEFRIQDYDLKAYLLRYTGEYKRALEILLPYINFLENERQFDALINTCDLAIDLCHRMNEPSEWIKWTIYQLRIINAQKAILTPKASVRLEELSKDLIRYAYLTMPHYYLLAYDYFIFTTDFKNGLYDINTGNGPKMRCYFNDAVCGKETDNYDDWLGNICNRYVLCIKESEGNDAALAAYISIRNALPESVQLWRGYCSHLACMCLYVAPNKAFEYYEEIITYIHKMKGLHTLPFHEYVDRAMSKFLSGDMVLAEAITRNALDICEANAILDEWGRCLNILGCIFVCQNRYMEAKALFKESTEMLKISGYKLFCWRSQLNYLHMALKDGDDSKPLSLEFTDAYQCFISLLRKKVIVLLQKETEEFVQSREYHALLSFGLYHSKIYGLGDNPILNDFELGHHQARYQDDLHLLQNTPSLALPDSPFFRSGMIMMIG